MENQTLGPSMFPSARRLFSSVFLLSFCFSGLESSAAERLRVMAANTSSGNQQAYEEPGIRIFQGLDADIILIQEFNFESGGLRDLVDEAFGEEFDFYIEGGGEQIPNGVVSRYPIVDSGEWNDSEVSNRDFAWARIDIPGEIDLWAVSVHFLTRNSSVRNRQASALVDFIENEVPDNAYLVVGGDFNTDSFGESGLATLSAVVRTDGRPDDQNGDTGTNASRGKPYDQVLPGPVLDTLETPVSIAGHGFNYAEGLVFDSRVFTPLSAVSPIRFGDSGASGMQHMAVIRDFLIPTGPIGTEPSAYPMDFEAVPAVDSIILSWTEVTNAPVPDGYLILGSGSDNIMAPSDGAIFARDTDLSDSSVEVMVAAGISSIRFGGLPPDTDFFFKIFPYTDSDTVDYKIDGAVPSLTERTLPILGNPPAAPTLGQVYYRHSAGFTPTWDLVESATGYRLDVSQNETFASGSGASLLDVNFDGSSSLPSAWTDGGTDNWTNNAHYESAPNCRAFGPGDTLETPAVDRPAELRFYADSSGGGNGQTATVSYSISGGSWQTLESFVVGTGGNEEVIDLRSSPDLTGVDGVRFRFESTFFTWYLDGVVVTGASGPGFVADYDDKAVGDTRYHAVEGLEADTTYYFRVRAENEDGASMNSATGTIKTTSSGSPYSVWGTDKGIGEVTLVSDFDDDQRTDYEEYIFATNPREATVQSDYLNAEKTESGFRVTHRKSKAPNFTWGYFGSSFLNDFEAPLIKGSSADEYQIVSRSDFGSYEEITVEINTANRSQFFFKVEVSEAP